MRITLLVVLLSMLSACSTLTSTERVSVSASQSWVLLPISNLSTTPRAGQAASSMAETHLRTHGVTKVKAYENPPALNLVSLLDDENQLNDARQWAKNNGFRFGLTGTIHEWHYKSGPDKEPAVGMSLKVIDLVTDEVVWQGTTAKTGWGYANVSAVANKVVNQLMSQISINRSK